MINLTPFLLFQGICAEAMGFYHACLGGELTLTRLKDTPMKDQMPAEQHKKIVYAKLNSGAIEFSASDWLHPTRMPKQGNTVAMHIHGGTYEEMKAVFEKLSVGANPETLDELNEMPFGSYGHLADKYGVHWFFKGEKRREQA
jgi:PhnB protein